MRYRLFSFIIIILFLVNFNTNSFAEVVLANSDIDSPDIIRHIKYLAKDLVIILGKQQKKEVIRILGSINSFVFVDSMWQDLAVELACKKSELTVKQEGIYEIYMERSQVSEEIPALKINIDGSEWGLYKGYQIIDECRKFIKVGEENFKQGKHIVTAVRIADYSEISKGDLKLVLVNKKEREGIEEIVWQKINKPQSKLGYIFEVKKTEFYIP